MFHCYLFDTKFSGGDNTRVWWRFIFWKQNGKIADKSKPMPKVWDTNIQ